LIENSFLFYLFQSPISENIEKRNKIKKEIILKAQLKNKEDMTLLK